MKSETDNQFSPVRVHPRWWYRIAYLGFVAAVVWLTLSGRLVLFFGSLQPSPHRGDPVNGMDHFVTSFIWLIGIAPLFLLSYDLGSQHIKARRLGFTIVRGLRETWRVAWQEWNPEDMAREFSEAPEDSIVAAVLNGVVIGALFFVLLFEVDPPMGFDPMTVWIGITSVLIGVGGYYRRRAAAYLRDDPGSWNMFRQWSLLNTERYEPAGHRFVRMQIVGMILLPIWWLGGGMMVFNH